jgi:hypothetical protein
MSIRRLLCQWVSSVENPAKGVGIVQSRPHHHLIEN